MPRLLKRIIFLLLVLNLQSIKAGGFQLWEESASGTADYHAGGAAEANDAGTTYYNPAGMIRLEHPQVSTGAVFIPLAVSFNGLVGDVPTGGYVSGNTQSIVPNAHFVLPLKSWVAFGLGITTPFGLATDYPGNLEPLNGAATLTRLETININPNLAFSLDSKLSVGVGFDAVYTKAKYNEVALGTTPFLNTLDAWGFGWNIGGLYQFTPNTRIGASYRSKISINAEGQSQVITPFLTLTSNTLNATLDLPSLAIFSFYSDVTSRWSLLASAYFTNWEAFDEIVLHNTALFPVITSLQNYRNTWNYAIGTHFKATRILLLKAGIGWDQTPTQIGYRDIRLPDAKRFAAALGGHIQATRRFGVDVGWTHFFTKAVYVDNSLSTLPDFMVTQGTAQLQANVVGLQLTADLN